MKNATMLCTLMAAALAAGVSPAYSQSADDPLKTGFIAVYGGAQPQRRDLSASTTQTIYEETATISSSQRVRNGALIEVGGGVKVHKGVAVGARFSMFGRPGTGTTTASIPDPIFFNRPKTVVATANDLEHKEQGIHINAAWFVPVSPKLLISVSAGPSIIHVTQDIASVSIVSGTQNITVARKSESGNAMGFNAGADILFKLAAQYGVGIFVHYAGGSLDLPSAPGAKVGGPQAGVVFQAHF